MNNLVQNFFNVAILSKVLPLLGQGLVGSAELVLLIVPLATALGLFLASLQRVPLRWLRSIIMAYVDIVRAIPPLVLLIIIYDALPFVNIKLPAFASAVVALSLNGSSFYGEIFRAGIESVAKGQMEAARSTGMTFAQAMWYVVIPQAVRNVLPDLITNTLELIKETSIASAVAIEELLHAAQTAESLFYNPTPLLAAAVIYFIVLWPMVRLISRLQRSLTVIR